MYEKKILDAIQLLVDNAINKASFDKTIKGIISKCVDEKNGKYVVIYQDSSFYAYSTDTSQIYSAGTPVYVLVPRNDMTQTKTIIGSVNKLGSDYINTVESINRYETIGNSIATLNTEQGVCSYVEGGDALVLYDKAAVSSIVNVDTVAAETYIKQGDYLILGGEFRTALNKEQKYKGNYGLGFDINFTDNMTNEIVKRTYLVDVNNMLGNPYEYTKASEQKVAFNIDGANFVDIDKIYLFCYDFPITSEDSKPDDIFITNLTLEAAAALTDDELAGNKLTLITPQGIIFNNNDSLTSSRKIDTEVKIENKVVNKDSSLLKYFWFKENYNIDTSSLLYNRYGGNGWECLNNYNIVERDENNNPTVIDWITNQSNLIIKKSDVIAKQTDYKCVVSYNNEIVLTKKFTIYNYSSNYDITITSDSGVYFSYDNGHPTLTCSVNQIDEYTYKWGMEDVGNGFTPIQETTVKNNQYHTAANKYTELETGLRNGTIVLTAAIQQEFNNLKYTLEQYNNDIERVEDNIIYNLKLNRITNFATFICAVYNSNDEYIGKGSIKIENDLNTGDNSYTLIINHGDQVFKYNGDGISPISKSLDNPQELYPLSFVLYDEKGNEISNEAIKANDVSWTVPTTNTMIKVSAVHGNPSSKDDYTETATYTGYKSFNFEIPVLYSVNKTRNTIKLRVKYKNKIVIANTELMFVKEGESGSNGTDFICRIVPNVAPNTAAPLYPIVTWNNNAAAGATNPTINFTPRTSGVWFKAQLYHNGSEIFDSPVSGVTTENKNVTVKWEMMRNKYDTTHSDTSNFIVNSSTGVFNYDNLNNVSDATLKENPANIVKCTLTYDGIDYVATMPIILVKVNNSGSAQYKVELIENTGFRYAMYTTDGRTPIYDNSNPFALKVIQTVENTDQDISTNTLTDYAVDYNWSVKGLIYTDNWETQSNLILDTLRFRNLQRNEIYYKPIDNFNGLCLNNALFCNIKRNNNTLATIHLPIHLYLNRYGNAAMNGWDGNHITIDEDGGFILAPQVGAGKKEQDNSFTGVFMGSVKEAGSSEEEVGLFGYNSGARTLELNSKDGSAKFGKVGSGQIIIEPGEDRAVIKSGDYEMILTQASGKYIAGNVYFSLSSGVYTELKEGTDYHNGDNITGGNIYVWSDGSGMEIDLNDPHIRFGSGNFRIDPDGNVYAKGYATIADLESGDIDIPGVETWKVEYATDRVEFETNSALVPTQTTLTKTITGKCLYKNSYVSGYTVQLVDASGSPISHSQATDGIGITTNVTGQTFTISFNAQSQYQWTNAVNNYYFKFSYTPIGSTIQTTIKQFSVNAVILGTDGQDGSDGNGIASTTISYKQGDDGINIPSDTPAWSPTPVAVDEGKYLWTRTVLTYDNGNTDTSYSVAKMGQKGETGAEGPTGPAGKDGTSVTVKGSYNSLADLLQAVSSHLITPTLGDGYIIGNDLYVYTNAAGGGGTQAGDWNDVGQFKGDDAKDCTITATSDVFKSIDGGSTYSPTSITITPFYQAVNYSKWSYSTNGGSSFSDVTSSTNGVSISNTSPYPLTVQNSSTLFNTNSSIVFKCNTNDANIYDVIAITKIKDGTNGVSATNVTCGNEMQGIMCNSSGKTTAASTITIPYAGYFGNDRAACTVTYSTLPSGITYNSSSSHSATTSADGALVFNVAANSNLGGDSITNGVITLTFTCNSRTFVKKFGWAKVIAGANGRSIAATEIRYVADNQGVNPPDDTANWDPDPPTGDTKGKFIWTRTRITYSDGQNPTTSYSVAYKGTDGTNGTSITISSQQTVYGYNNSGTDYSTVPASRSTQNPGGWGTTIPDTPDGKYLWTRTTVVYSDNTTTVSYSVSYQSKDGESATQYYTHIMYAEDASGTGISSSPTGKTYIGLRVDEIPTASVTPSDYIWSKFIGTDGTNGTNGTDGFSLWTTTKAPTNSVYQRSDLVGPSSTQSPRVGEIIIRSNRYQYTVTAVSGASITVSSPVDLRGTDGTSIIWKGDSASAPSNPETLWAYYNTTNKKAYIYNGSSWDIMSVDGTPGTDATQYYYHVVYCNDTRTGAGYSTTPSNQLYTGTYVDTTSADAADWSTLSGKTVKWNYTKGDDATNVVCGNEAQTISCTDQGVVVATTGIVIPFAGYKGNARAACTVACGTLPDGMSVTSNTAATTSADGSLVLSAAANSTLGGTDNGIINLTFTCNSKTFAKKFSWAKVKSGGDAYTVVLSNESHTFPASNSAAIQSSTTIEVSAYKGATAVTPSIGTITGQVTGLTTEVSGTTITVKAATTLTTQNGVLTIPVTVDGKPFTKKFSWSLAKAGADSTAYSLIISHAAVVKTTSNTYSPAAITLTAKKQTGNNAITNFTSGRYAIFLNGSSTASTTTSSSTAGYSYTIPASTTSIRVALYNSSSGTTILDEQTIPIVYDGTNGTSPYNAYLTNESQTFAYGTAKSIATNLYFYQGTIEKSITLKKIGTYSITDSTPTTQDCATGKEGMNFRVSSISSVTHPTITFKSTTGLAQTQTEQIAIEYLVAGESTNRTIYFSYASTTRGAGGTNANLVDITASSQMFKSTDGGVTFSPNTITLTPRFQNVTYSKWQYSTNGGSSWTDVTSGQHGLTISSGVLTIAKGSDLYTSSVTSIVFKCISSNSSVFDTMTIVKLYDVTDIEVGGRNLLLKSNATTTSPSSYLVMKYDISDYGKLIANKVYTISLNFTASEERKGICCYVGGGSLAVGAWKAISAAGTYTYTWTFTATSSMASASQFINVYCSTTGGGQGSTPIAGTCNVNWIKLEKGNQATDWTAAPEDIKSNQILWYTTTTTSAAPSVNQDWYPSVPVSTTNYIWQRMQTTYDNGITEYSTPVCIYIPPTQISSIEEQYFIHTSDTIPPSQSSDAWLDKKPEWKDEYYNPDTRRYLWVRTEYIYTGNEERVEYSTPYYDPTWESISLLNASIVDNAKLVSDAIDNGYVTIKDGYIEIKDVNDSNKGILLSKEGISFKINGNTYTSVWSLDGTFNAQSILVKNLNASDILSGTLTLRQASDATNGVLQLLNSSGSEVAKIDVNGLKITAVDGSYIYLRTGIDDNTKKGIYLVDAVGTTFVSTDTTHGIFTTTKQVITDYQQFGNNARIIPLGTRGIGFIGLSS